MMGSPGGGVGGGSDSSSNDIQSRQGMTGSERTQDAEARSDRTFSDDLAEAKAESERNKSPNDDGGSTAPSTPPDAPAAPESDDEPQRVAGPPSIGAPPPNAEDLGPALTGDLDPGLTPGQSASLAEGAAVMQGSTFAGTITTIGAGIARGFGMGFGGVYATGGPPSLATPFPHDDAVVIAGATIVGAGAAVYGGYQAYQALAEPQSPSIVKSEGAADSDAKGGRSVPVGDLEPLHDAETSGKRPELEKLTDDELIDAVENPSDGERVKVSTESGKVVDGNGRVRELQERAKDPSSSITPDTEITVEDYTPDQSAFDWDK